MSKPRLDSDGFLRWITLFLAALVWVMLIARVAAAGEPDWQGVGFSTGAGLFTLGLWAAAKLYRNRW